MTYLNILGDGTVFPPLRPYDLVIMLSREVVQAGRYVKENFIRQGKDYIETPLNLDELRVKIFATLQNENPQLLEKKHDLHLLCPKEISAMAQWPVTEDKGWSFLRENLKS